MMLASIAEREQFRGLLVAKIQNIPHIRSNSLEKSTSFNGKMNAVRHKVLQFIPEMGRIATFLCWCDVKLAKHLEI